MAEHLTSRPVQRRYPPELKERAIRLVAETAAEHGERHGAVGLVARQLGIGPESLRHWVRQAADFTGFGHPVSREMDTLFRRKRPPCSTADSGERRNTHEIGELRWVVEGRVPTMQSVRRSRG